MLRGWFKVVGMFEGMEFLAEYGVVAEFGVRGATSVPCYFWSHLLLLFDG